MTKEQAIKNLLEIVELSKDEIKSGNTNIAATLDYEDLKSLQIALNMLKEKDKEIEKKDKQIDLMAIRILVKIIGDYPCTYKESCTKSDEKYRDFKCKKCIKQYFERKSEE